jgi:hypothetical protein
MFYIILMAGILIIGGAVFFIFAKGKHTVLTNHGLPPAQQTGESPSPMLVAEVNNLRLIGYNDEQIKQHLITKGYPSGMVESVLGAKGSMGLQQP